jgi:hypothetical protein
MIELPPHDTKRGSGRRKAVIQAVRLGQIGLEEACLRYNLSVEELFGWERVPDQHGHPRPAGHQATDLPRYHGPSSAKGSS